MALVPETGTGDNPAANSFASLDEIKAYLTQRGVTLPADATIEQYAHKAMDYLIALEPQMLGYRTFGADQPLPYPRLYVYWQGEYLASDEIPVMLKNAQAELVGQQIAGVSLVVTISTAAVKKRKVGPIEREFFGPAPSNPVMPAFLNWITPLLTGVGFGNVPVVRV